jgi:uncharacterized ion transporter superfamily protein YfcC
MRSTDQADTTAHKPERNPKGWVEVADLDRRQAFYLIIAVARNAYSRLSCRIEENPEYAIHMKIGNVHYWSPTQQKAYRYLKDFVLLIVNQIFPIVIWSVLYVKYWWDKRLSLDIR